MRWTWPIRSKTQTKNKLFFWTLKPFRLSVFFLYYFHIKGFVAAVLFECDGSNGTGIPQATLDWFAGGTQVGGVWFASRISFNVGVARCCCCAVKGFTGPPPVEKGLLANAPAIKKRWKLKNSENNKNTTIFTSFRRDSGNGALRRRHH